MPRVSDFSVIQREDQPALFVRTRTKVEDLPALIGASYGKIAAHLESLGMFPSGFPYVGYHNMDMQDLDVEIGFPVSTALPGKGDIQSGHAWSGKAVFCVHRGAYGEMAATYDEMAKWIGTNEFTPTGTAYECYLNGPGCPENELLTIIVMPVS